MKRKKVTVKIGQHFEAPRAGIIYKSIVRKAFMNKNPDEDEKEIEAMLARGDMDEIGETIDIRWVIERIVEVLKAELAEEGIRLPSDFTEVILYSETPEEDAEEVVVEVKLRNFSEEGKDALRKDVLMELAPILLFNSSCMINQVYLDDIFKLLELDTGRELEELY